MTALMLDATTRGDTQKQISKKGGRILIRDMVFGIQTGIKRSDWLSRPGNEHQKFNSTAQDLIDGHVTP